MCVIKLLSIVEEISNEQKVTSWLKPDGEFVYVGKNHSGAAVQLAGTTNDAMEVLFRKGWLRVTYYTRDVLYAHNPFVRPNDTQVRLLIDLAKEMRFPKLIYDNDRTDRILWSVGDMI